MIFDFRLGAASVVNRQSPPTHRAFPIENQKSKIENPMRSISDLAKHSSIYGLGQIINRFASVLILPLYTHYLSPADYGVIAILDLTTMILAMMIGAGMSQAVTRYHFEAKSEEDRRVVWWTGTLYVAAMASLVVAPMWLCREGLARLTLGQNVPQGATFYAFALGTLWCNTIDELLDVYVRVKKWSGLYLVVSTGRLFLNMGLNVWFLVGMGLGVKGQLIGNLISSVVYGLVLLAIFRRANGRVTIDSGLVRKLLIFGSPIIVQALLSILMHEADRFFLLAYVEMGDVGVYSLAYKIGQAVNALCLIPFASIWGVVLYEIAKQPDSKKQYAAVFSQFLNAILILMLGASLCARPLLPYLTTDAFDGAVELLPIILLAFVFFSLHGQFNVPALLAKKTVTLVPPALAGVIVNLTLNAILVPKFGVVGAAWVSVLTYATYSFVGLAMYRRIDVIPYPFVRSALTTLGIGATYFVVHYALVPSLSKWAQIGVAVGVCAVWAVVLFGRQVSRFLCDSIVPETTPASDETPVIATAE